MKNLAVRWKILGGVLVVNAIGALAVVVYLHQSYSNGLDVTAQRAVTHGVMAADELRQVGVVPGAVGTTESPWVYVEHLGRITGDSYGLLLDKSRLDEEEYAAGREAAGLANNWDERENYVLAGVTDEAISSRIAFEASSDSVPEMGKIVGIENGACSKMCHESIDASGDYWGVAWSEDRTSRIHGVFPVTDDAGEPIGVMYLIEDISDQANAALAAMLQTLGVIATTLVIATVMIGGMLDTLVFKRIEVMIGAMEDISTRIAGGDFTAHYQPSGRGDEIGRFEEFFAKFLDTMAATIKAMLGK